MVSHLKDSLARLAAVGILMLAVTEAKVYERCALAKELRDVHEIPEDQVATWVCIARHESEYNTSAVGHANGDGSGDHGLFQISDIYWCSPPGKGWACGVSCAELEDDDISNDIVCARRIYRQHQRLSGNGFTAWAVYRPHCSDDSLVAKYIEGCYIDDHRGGTTTLEPTEEEEPQDASRPYESNSLSKRKQDEAKARYYGSYVFKDVKYNSGKFSFRIKNSQVINA